MPYAPETLAKASESFLLNDETLRKRVEKLFHDTLRQMEWTMKWGSPQEKAMIQRLIMSTLFKGLGNIHSKAADEEELAAYRALRAEMQESLSQGVTIIDVAD